MIREPTACVSALEQARAGGDACILGQLRPGIETGDIAKLGGDAGGLSSLIVNALDSLLDRPERTVSVKTGCTKDAAWFEVEDSGCGIPEENLPRIFSPSAYRAICRSVGKTLGRE